MDWSMKNKFSLLFAALLLFLCTPALAQNPAGGYGPPSGALGNYSFSPPLSTNTVNGVVNVSCAACSGTTNAQGANQLTSGGMVEWTGGYDFTVGAAAYTISGASYNSPATNITLSTPDVTNDRIDVIIVNNTGAVSVIIGTPAATPVQPSYDPSSQLELTFVYVTANSSAPVQITKTDIYHSNTEWTVSRSSAVWTLASTNNPYDGTVDIEATNVATAGDIQLVDPASATVDLAQSNALVFYVRSKAAWPSTRSVSIEWLNGSTVKGQVVLLRDGVFGFNSSNISTYQQISIPTSAFGIAGTPVTQLRYIVTGTGANLGFYLDDITLQGGAAQITLPTGIMIYRSVYSATTAYNANDVVSSGGQLYLASVPSTGNAPASSRGFWTPIGNNTDILSPSKPAGVIGTEVHKNLTITNGSTTDILATKNGTGYISELFLASSGYNTEVIVTVDGEGTPSIDTFLPYLLGEPYVDTQPGFNGTYLSGSNNGAGNPGGTFRIPIPFASSVRVQVKNATLSGSIVISSYVVYHTGISDNWAYTQRLKVVTNAGSGIAGNTETNIVNVTPNKNGRLLGVGWLYDGTVGSVSPATAPLEGAFKIYIDGAGSPNITTSGTEDFFGTGWYFQHFTTFGSGSTANMAPGNSDNVLTANTGSIFGAQRFFTRDPITFTTGLKLSWTCGNTSAVSFSGTCAFGATVYYYQEN
jgi:hypothetical protein